MNNTAEIIRRAVTMKDICAHYGLRPNGAGFAKCPFHSGDREPSLKIYPNNRGWHCFGCGKGGSVIDFVEEMCGAGFSEAVKIINDTFRLGLPVGKKSSYRERMRFAEKYNQIQKEYEEKKTKRDEKHEAYELWLNEWICADMIIRALSPASPDDEIDEILQSAYLRILVAGYMLDGLEEG